MTIPIVAKVIKMGKQLMIHIPTNRQKDFPKGTRVIVKKDVDMFEGKVITQ